MATNYGREMSCTTSVRSGLFVSGTRLVAEACYRRLTTPRGMLRGGEEEKNYGLDLSELVGTVTSQGQAAALEGRIRAELLKDQRVETVDVTVVDTFDGVAHSFAIAIDCEGADGPFTLQILATAVSVQLLDIGL